MKSTHTKNVESNDLIQEVRLSSKEESDYWPQFLQKLQEEAPARIEDAAKFFFGVVSLTLAVLTKNISANDLQQRNSILIFAPWLLSIILSLFVLVPFKLHAYSNSSESIKKAIAKTTIRKTRLFVLSIFFYVAALILTIILLSH